MNTQLDTDKSDVQTFLRTRQFSKVSSFKYFIFKHDVMGFEAGVALNAVERQVYLILAEFYALFQLCVNKPSQLVKQKDKFKFVLFLQNLFSKI